MALFVDGGISSIEDLLGYDSAILDVAKVEGIDLTVKLQLAEEELGMELEALLSGRSEAPELGQVVVTAPLEKWDTFRTLSVTYRDAYYRQLNDRYLGKWKEYERLSQWALDMLRDGGVGVVDDPLPRPAAPVLSTTGSTLGAATYFVQVTWVNAAGEESAPSAPAAISAPSGMAPVASVANAPAGAIGWNVYAGYAAINTRLANEVPLGRTVFWTPPTTGLPEGREAGTGQTPTRFFRLARMF